MILHPESEVEPSRSATLPAWDAVACAQRLQAAGYLLVYQPDHARLSGELARHFAIEDRPRVTEEILRGIAAHDDGWEAFDTGREKLQATAAVYPPEGVPLSPAGKPLSFEEIKPGDFLRAWRRSIAAAEAIAPIAGLMVSGHFYRLATFGLNSHRYAHDDAELVRQFVQEEERRREQLCKREARTLPEIEYWTDVLQFCDLLSLYLCCGSEANVEFPQRIAEPGAVITLRYEGGTYVSSPSLYATRREFTLQAHQFPGTASATLRWSVR